MSSVHYLGNAEFQANTRCLSFVTDAWHNFLGSFLQSVKWAVGKDKMQTLVNCAVLVLVSVPDEAKMHPTIFHARKGTVKTNQISQNDNSQIAASSTPSILPKSSRSTAGTAFFETVRDLVMRFRCFFTNIKKLRLPAQSVPCFPLRFGLYPELSILAAGGDHSDLYLYQILSDSNDPYMRITHDRVPADHILTYVSFSSSSETIVASTNKGAILRFDSIA